MTTTAPRTSPGTGDEGEELKLLPLCEPPSLANLRVEPAAAAALDLMPRPAASRLLLRRGVGPNLFVADIAALAVGLAIGWRGPTDLLVPPLALALYQAGGLYNSRLSLSLLRDLPALLGRGLIATAVVAIARRPDGGAYLSQAALLGICLLVFFRGAAYGVVRRCRTSGLVAHRALILGAGQVGSQLAELLETHPEYGLSPIGFLDDQPLPSDGRTAPVLGRPEELAEAIRRFQVKVVIVAFGGLREPQMVSVLRTCDKLNCEIAFVPRLFELGPSGGDIDHVWGIPLIRLRRSAFRPSAVLLKRILDLVVASIALILLAPLLAVIALAVRLEGGAGVIFKQVRIGIDGRPFTLLKFRSLTPADDDESAVRWSLANDTRIGRVGALLRATSFDELPQLWNVLRGDMSLVGPRPERPHYVRQFTPAYPHYLARHRVPSGLTGWAQVHGLRGDTSIDERVRFDNAYIEGWSFWGDVKILLLTVSEILRRAGT